MVRSKIRVRKSSYELVTELIYRLELNLLGRKEEFGNLSARAKTDLSNLLVALRTAKTSIEGNCILAEGFSTRSKELNAVLGAIEMLKDAEILSITEAK